MPYTVNQLAKLSSVSVRTLHYYDEIELLKPSKIANNGYRLYDEPELLRLQQILFFRELEFSLEEIKRFLSQPEYQIAQSLRDQKHLIELKRARLDRLINTIDVTMNRMTSDDNKMPDEELYDAFKDDDVKQYQVEVEKRWGNTDAYKQSQERVGKMTKAQMTEMKEAGKRFTQELADSMDMPINDPVVQVLVERHYQGIQTFYDCTPQMHRTLGQMYGDDPRFTAYYDKFRPGLAMFLRDAIHYYWETHS